MSIPSSYGAFVWHFVRQQKIGFIALVLTSLVTAISGTIWPEITGKLVDTLSHCQTKIDIEQSTRSILTIVFGFWILVEGVSRLRGLVFSFVIPKMEVSIRTKIFRHVSLHSHSYFIRNYIGSIANRMSDLPRGVTLALDILFTNIFPVLIGMVISSVVFIHMHYILAVILLIWLSTHLGICVFFSKKSANLSRIQSEARTLVQGKIVDTLSNHMSVRLFNRYDYESKYIVGVQTDEQKKHIKSLLYIEKVKMALGCLGIVGMSTLFYISLLFWQKQMITTGDVVTIVSSTVNLMTLIWIASDEMTYLFMEIGLCQQGLKIIQDPIQIHEQPHAKNLDAKDGNIRFEDVSFSYENNKIVFKKLSTTLLNGQTVALVGHSGSGKTTFVSLLLRLFDPQSGAISIDGQDIKSVTLSSLREAITFVPQDPVLFHRSIYENILYGNTKASEADVVRVTRLAQCHDFILSLPNGYQTVVGERGATLSGGERQRIAIARALLNPASIVVLDEATSALDLKNEALIQKAVESLRAQKTLIIISHRLSSLTPKVDRILVFKDQTIVEDGKHLSLLDACGHYFEIWNSQNAATFEDYQIKTA